MEQKEAHRSESDLEAQGDLAIWIRLELASRARELALLFNLDSVRHGEPVAASANVMQQKTQRQLQFEVTEHTRESVAT